MNYENISTTDLIELKKDLENRAARLDSKQLAFKILLNSAYGALGNAHFRHYQLDYATAITISGQGIWFWVAGKLNEYINKIVNSTDVDYVIYGDTDSLYLNLTPLVAKFASDKNVNDKIDFVCKAADTKFQEVIKGICDEFSKRTNAFENHLDLKRESVAEAVFIKKKRYTMRVFDSEGVRFATPELKVVGLEAVRSQTPEFCRDKMKEIYSMIFSDTQERIVDRIEEIKSEFMNLNLEEIGENVAINNMEEYDGGDHFKPKAPSQVKAGITFNRLIDKYNLQNSIRKINNGDKAKVVMLKNPNPTFSDAIAFVGGVPEEFGIDKYIDREGQYNKTFFEPVKRVLDVIGYKSDNNPSITDFF